MTCRCKNCGAIEPWISNFSLEWVEREASISFDNDGDAVAERGAIENTLLPLDWQEEWQCGHCAAKVTDLNDLVEPCEEEE